MNDKLDEILGDMQGYIDDDGIQAKVLSKAKAKILALHKDSSLEAVRSERAWAYKNMRDHGTDKEWVEVAKLRFEKSEALLNRKED